MIRKRIITRCFSFSLLVAVSVSAGEIEELIKAGNAAFRQEQYSDALEQYQIAETEIPESPELDYNIAGVLHRQEKYEEALERYDHALNSQEISLHSRTKYNLGNTYYRMGDFAKAIESFQQALESNPDDLDAKFNLELARKMLKEQIKPEEQNGDENSRQQQQEQQQQEQDQEQNQDQEQQQQQDQQDQQEPQDQQQQEQQEAKPISKEDAERILNALKDDEQDVQKKIKRQVSGGDYTGNDW